MAVPSIPLSPVESPAAAPPARPSGWFIALGAFARGVMAAAVVVSALLGLEYDLGLPRLVGAAVMAFLGFAFVSAGEGIVILVRKLFYPLLRRLRPSQGARLLASVPPVPVGRILGAFIYIAGDMLWPDSFLQHITLPVAGEMAMVLTGLTVMAFTLARSGGLSGSARYALLAISALFNLAFITWIATPGFAGYLATLPETAAAATLSLDDPGRPGPYRVEMLTYGSGAGQRRPQFGQDADLITPVVDGSPIFDGYSGLIGRYYRWYWGHDFSRLPLNGTVWYPVADAPAEDGSITGGPFPLVLIVHGNHAMSQPSDPGYAYLGAHLASHGYIAVSVDENFLNGLMFFDGDFQEMPLRAWLLLQHLGQWRTWNEMPGNPFTGRVDMEQLALIGHSRGGEAVAWAAQLNWQSIAPVSNVSQTGDFRFDIDAVVSIAPSDAYSGPGGRKPTLGRTSYLLLAGGHDSDTFLLYGQRQYNRVRLNDNPEGFKALAYVYQANHGQFNTVWGDQDRGRYNSWLLNRAPLLTGPAQQQAAKVLITGFLEAALRRQDGYRDLFRNPAAGAGWLPPGIVVTQYRDAGFIPVDTNNGSTTLAATEIEGAKASARGTSAARVEPLLLRDGQLEQGNRVLYLAWEAGSKPVYEITLPEQQAGSWGLGAEHSLTFALAAVPGEAAAGEIRIEVETSAGEGARLPLGDFGPLMPALPAYLVKAGWLAGLQGFPGDMTPEEVVLQSYTLPLAAFEVANPAFRPEQLGTIRFLFEGSRAGAIYLDNIEFGSGPLLP